MAKKGGLGRGLNSLLGNEVDVPAKNEFSQRRDQSDSNEAIGAKAPNAPVPKAQPSAKESNKVEEEKKEVKLQKPDEELYSNKEDNITIKSVVERKVDRPTTSTDDVKKAPTKEKESQVEEKKKDDELPIDLIEPNPTQPRTYFNKETIEELAESIKKNGLLQPILVRKKGDKYEIVAGERRWQACKINKMETVPVKIVEASDEEAIIMALVENIQRSDLNPIEEAYGYRRMMERGKMTQSQVAQAVSKGRSTIANALRLLELPEEAQQLLFEEKITAGHARAILSVPTKEGREKLTQKLKNENLSVRETEAIARLMSLKKEDKSSEKTQVPKTYKTVARSLKDTLKTEVRIKSSHGKNRIEISFKDEADLERLFRIIASEQAK